VTRVLPSGKKATALTPAVWPRSVATSSCIVRLQSLTVLSWLLVASVLPSGEKATPETLKACPWRGRPIPFQVAVSHSLTVASLLAVAMTRPSGEKAMHLTGWVCPKRVATTLRVEKFHTVTLWLRSQAPVTSSLRSGETPRQRRRLPSP